MQTDTMKVSPLKVNLTRNRSLHGRALSSFTAHLGETGWKATGTCKQGALDQLFADLKNAEENTFRRKYVRKGQVTFALYFAGGWCYDIVRDDGSASTGSLLANSYQDAVNKMLAHVAQHEGQ